MSRSGRETSTEAVRLLRESVRIGDCEHRRPVDDYVVVLERRERLENDPQGAAEQELGRISDTRPTRDDVRELPASEPEPTLRVA